jgi:hypothetical protein
MASINTKARELWQLRERAIRAALAKLADEHGVPNKFSAGDVAGALPRTVEYSGAWTPAQRDELTTWIQRAGRRMWGYSYLDGGRPYSSPYPIRYVRGWFVVRGEQSQLFGIPPEASNLDAHVAARRANGAVVAGGERTAFVPVGEG